MASPITIRRTKMCRACGAEFLPRVGKQVYCDPCHTPCPDCGKPKDVRALRCRSCAAIQREGVPAPHNRRTPPPIDEVIAQCEGLGLPESKQYAFGYVIGVIFGDGSVSRVVDRIKFQSRSGRISVFEVASYRPRLGVTSRAFAERFAAQWAVLTGRIVGVREGTRRFGKATLPGMPDNLTITIYTVNPRHTLLGRYLANLKYERGPATLPEFPEDVRRGILAGMIDSEGYIAPKYIDITNKDRALLLAIDAICTSLGKRSTIYDSPSQKVLHLRIT